MAFGSIGRRRGSVGATSGQRRVSVGWVSDGRREGVGRESGGRRAGERRIGRTLERANVGAGVRSFVRSRVLSFAFVATTVFIHNTIYHKAE